MSTKRLNRETRAWALALVIGLVAYLAQPGPESRIIQIADVDVTSLIRESDHIQKHEIIHLPEEFSRTGIVLDNSKGQ